MSEPVITEEHVRKAADIVALQMATEVLRKRHPRKLHGWFWQSDVQTAINVLEREVEHIRST